MIYDNFVRGREENLVHALKDPRVRIFEALRDGAEGRRHGTLHVAADLAPGGSTRRPKLPELLCGALAGKFGKVVLSGARGDELFGGHLDGQQNRRLVDWALACFEDWYHAFLSFQGRQG